MSLISSVGVLALLCVGLSLVAARGARGPECRTNEVNSCSRSARHCPSVSAGDYVNTVDEGDFYLLSVSWTPAFCCGSNSNPPCSECSHENQKNTQFYLHGLWPQCDDPAEGQLGYCCERCKQSAVPGDLYSVCKNIISNVGWCSSVSLGGGEWFKHGTCSGMNLTNYLTSAEKAYQFALNNFNNLASAALNDPDSTLPLTQVLAAFPPNSVFEVNNRGGNRNTIHVNEIRLCFRRTSPSNPTPLISPKGMNCPYTRLPSNQDKVNVLFQPPCTLDSCRVDEPPEDPVVPSGGGSSTGGTGGGGSGTGGGGSSSGGSCSFNKRGPACGEDSDCCGFSGCARCAGSGYCTADTTKGNPCRAEL